jgi:hypothetical protein
VTCTDARFGAFEVQPLGMTCSDEPSCNSKYGDKFTFGREPGSLLCCFSLRAALRRTPRSDTRGGRDSYCELASELLQRGPQWRVRDPHETAVGIVEFEHQEERAGRTRGADDQGDDNRRIRSRQQPKAAEHDA